MYALVYQSKANTVLGLNEIQEMFVKARRFNQKHEITGYLLFYSGDFIQSIEGKQETFIVAFLEHSTGQQARICHTSFF